MDNIVDALNNAYQDFLAAAAGICQFFPRYWSCNALQSSPVVTKLVPAVGIIIFTLWGLEQLMRMSRHFFFACKEAFIYFDCHMFLCLILYCDVAVKKCYVRSGVNPLKVIVMAYFLMF